MTQQEFISLTEREVFAEMLRNINELFGQSKSASLFISLFSSVRCKIVLQQYNHVLNQNFVSNIFLVIHIRMMEL